MQFKFYFVDPISSKVQTSDKSQLVAPGGSVSIFCRPESPSLRVWWSAVDTEGEAMDVLPGRTRVDVSASLI